MSAEAATGEAWEDISPDAARRLVVAAVQAFAERGYHATTTRDIAGRAGMSPAALYIHYKTKEELLYQISRVGHQRSLALLCEARDSAGGPADQLATAVSAFVRWHAEHHTTGRVVQYELGALAPDHYAEIVVLRRQSEETIRTIIADGVAAGEFDVPEVSGTTLAVLSLCIDVARWFNPAGRRTPDEVGALYADLVLRMVRAEGAPAAATGGAGQEPFPQEPSPSEPALPDSAAPDSAAPDSAAGGPAAVESALRHPGGQR